MLYCNKGGNHMRKCMALFLTLMLLLSVIPAGGMASGVSGMEISEEVSFDKGITTVFWQDAYDWGPYMVGYTYYDPASSVRQQGYWAGGNQDSSTTSDCFFAVDQLIAGHQYEITVFNSKDYYATGIVALPAAETFVDGKLKASSVRVATDYKYYDPAKDSMHSLDALKASDIIDYISDRYYGFRYEITLPELAYARDYFVQVFMRSPTGFGKTIFTSQYVFSTGTGFTHYVRLIGDDFFAALYKCTGEIPVGDYTVELYFNGMLAHSKTIKVK